MALMLNKHGQLERIHIPVAPPQRQHSRAYTALAVLGRVLLVVGAVLLKCIMAMIRDEVVPLLGIVVVVSICLMALLAGMLVIVGG